MHIGEVLQEIGIAALRCGQCFLSCTQFTFYCKVFRVLYPHKLKIMVVFPTYKRAAALAAADLPSCVCVCVCWWWALPCMCVC